MSELYFSFSVVLEQLQPHNLLPSERRSIGIIEHYSIQIQAKRQLALDVRIPKNIIPSLHALIKDSLKTPLDDPLKIVSIYFRERLEPTSGYILKNVIQLEDGEQEGMCQIPNQ